MSAAHVMRLRAHDGTEIVVSGELDIASAPTLRAELDRVVRQEEGTVVVDLGDVTFIDSTGLAVLLNATRRLTRARRRFAVRCGSGPAREVIERSRLAETFSLTR